jgi:hypothetical protein
MNTQLVIKLEKNDNSISLTYKPSEFQAGYQIRDLKYIMSLGSKTTILYDNLSKLNSLLSTEYNIYDYLVAKGVTDVNPSLKLKKLKVSRLLNSVPATKLDELTTILSNAFIKDVSFYDFSLGMLEVVSQNIKKGLDTDFIKINRRINHHWFANVTVETTEGYSYQAKGSSFSFRDNYKFRLDELESLENITKSISEMFATSIRPYIDIFMEKIVPDAFRNIRSFCSGSSNIHHQFEQLAWELYDEHERRRHTDDTIYDRFNELTLSFTDKSVAIPQLSMFAAPKRSYTAAISAASTSDESTININYAKFSTYYNTFHQQWINRDKKGLEHPKFMNLSEINALITRIKRYFGVIKIGDMVFNDILSKKDTLTSFTDIIHILEEEVFKYVDAVCEHYHIDSEISE